MSRHHSEDAGLVTLPSLPHRVVMVPSKFDDKPCRHDIQWCTHMNLIRRAAFAAMIKSSKMTTHKICKFGPGWMTSCAELMTEKMTRMTL